ncbi:uncharacterized protein B0T15DRAFT_39883 [Chaetomium strumarium]|uniref:Uncharacterized protein n=1 Tax=Chaetomium strumarium TaxID=1170767 RepID=A0AAJ0H2W1_9PEZI|nr:hypothetical protein B0T15DRAFT_39883 [Chaetomium strumarium]
MDTLGIDPSYAAYQHQHHNHTHGHFATQQLPSITARKRKADAPPENNERLSKRMSLLNLEQSGQKLLVPVENIRSHFPDHINKSHENKQRPGDVDDSRMQLDDTKYKVYINNLDDELASDNESDGESGMVFLPDIEKYLRATRIPTRVLDPRPDPAAELAGKELVLYSEPSSISVPIEQDSVRRAILEARARAREKQRAEREREPAACQAPVPGPMTTLSAPSARMLVGAVSGLGHVEDPDAMELD